MGEKELGDRLLELDARTLAGTGDPREQTWRIIDRDRRRVWWISALTIALWGRQTPATCGCGERRAERH
jgi:hypothetical protein